MSEKTDIAWTDSTFNPWWGCSKVSEGCRNCYAEGLARRFGGETTIWGKNARRRVFGESHWKDPVKWNRKAEKTGNRIRVFCGSMMDVFENHKDVTGERKKLWNLIAETPFLDWQLLTKRPRNIGLFLPEKYLPNVWLGVTIENQEVVSRLDELRKYREQVPVLFASCEPLLGPIEADFNGIDWTIIGGESGRSARPLNLAWVRNIMKQARAVGSKIFVKQMGSKWAKETGAVSSAGVNPEEWPSDLRVRKYPISPRNFIFQPSSNGIKHIPLSVQA